MSAGAVAQLRHDRGGQVAAGFAAFGLGGDVVAVEGEVVAQPGGGAAGAGQPQRADPGEDPRTSRQVLAPDSGLNSPVEHQVAQPVQERFDVAAAQQAGVVAVVGAAAAAALRQPHQAGERAAQHAGGAVAAAARAARRRPTAWPPARSQGCEIVVNLSRPASPNTARSHTSLAFSVSGSASAARRGGPAR